LVNSRQNNISELRLKRIGDLLNRNERTDYEEKELKYVKYQQQKKTQFQNFLF
jgi:hypothetical protein